MRVSSCSECSCGISANEKKIAIESYPILSKRIRERIHHMEGQCSYQQRRPAVVVTPVQHLMAQRYRYSATEGSKQSSDSLQCTDVHTIVDGDRNSTMGSLRRRSSRGADSGCWL
jgi:hypothetical protein